MPDSRPLLVLQVLLVLAGWFFVVCFVGFNATLIWKGSTLPYTNSNYNTEFVMLWLLGGLEALRTFFAIKGNLTQRPGPVILSMVMTMLTITCLFYEVFGQTYVLRIENILYITLISIEGVELLLMGLAVLQFSAKKF